VIKKAGVIAVAGVFLASQAGWAGLSFQDLELPVLLFPPVSDCYTIEAVTRNLDDPGSLVFTLDSPHAEYEVQGLVNLRQRLQEIRVIETLKEGEWTGGNLTDGVTDAVVDTGEGLKNLVVHPIRSAKGMGTAVGKIGKTVGRVFRGKNEGEKTTFGENMMGSTKRQIAKNLGVDVYSKNPHLQKKLDVLAQSKMGGKGVMILTNLLMPFAMAISLVVTASSLNAAADELVNDSSRPELYEANKKALMDIGFDVNSAKMLLDLPYYTPREATYLRFCLEKLRRARGFERIAAAAMNATTEAQAIRVLYEAEIAADMADSIPGLFAIRETPEGLAVGYDRQLVFITGYDYLDRSPLGDRVVDAALRMREELGKDSVEIVSAGILEKSWTQDLVSRGIRTRKLALFVKATEAAGKK